MAVTLSAFRPIRGLENVFVAERANLRCSAIRLSDGGLCLFSPVNGLGDEALASLSKVGEVRALLAPNHYHNNGLAQYHRQFPGARLCSSETARPRLQMVTGLRFETLENIGQYCPQRLSAWSHAASRTARYGFGPPAGQMSHGSWPTRSAARQGSRTSQPGQQRC